MSIQRKKLNIGKERRRVQIRSALLLTLGACCLVSLLRMALAGVTLPYALRFLLETLVTLLAFGGGAYLGLCVLDGDHKKIVPVRLLSRAQMLWLSLLGVLTVCPMALASDLLGALVGGQVEAAAAVLDSSRFLAQAVKSALIVPVAEELFFRGYLLHALQRDGRLRAGVVTALCFALVHMHGAANLGAYALLGLLLALITFRTGSLLAPILVHACYNLTLLVLGGAGLSGMLIGWSAIACIVRLAGCAAFAAVLKRAHTARGDGRTFVLWEEGQLSRRETALLIASGILLLLSLIIGG